MDDRGRDLAEVREAQRRVGPRVPPSDREEFLTLPPEEKLALIAEYDRRIDELLRQAAEDPEIWDPDVEQ